MADNSVLNTGSGGDTYASNDIGGIKYQRVKAVLGAAGTAIDPSAGNGVSGTGVQRVTIASDSTGQVALAAGSASIGTLGANAGVQIGDIKVNNATGASSVPVQGAVASAGTNGQNPVKIGAVFNTTKPTVSDGQVVDLQATNRGELTVANGPTTFNATINAALPAGTNVIGHVIVDSGAITANAGTNLNTSALALEAGNLATLAGAVTSSILQDNIAKINNVTPLMGNGVTGTGSQRVTIASDNTANSNPFLVTQTPSTTGGLSTSSVLLTASNNLTSTKGSAGTLFAIQAFGTGSAPYWLKLYNKATAPVVASDTPVKRILVPANATAANGAGVTMYFGDSGIAFGTGIAWAAVGLQADTDNTNTAAAGAVNIDYK